MSQGNSVETLLEEARLAAEFASPTERLRLREAAGFSRAHVATAVGVGRPTVANWETGVSEPAPPGRLQYLRLLKGLAQIYPATPAPAAAPAPAAPRSASGPGAQEPAPAPAAFMPVLETLRGLDGRAVECDPGPCIRCGVTTTYQSTDGRPLHSGALCQPAGPATVASPAPAAPAPPAPAPAPVSPAPVP